MFEQSILNGKITVGRHHTTIILKILMKIPTKEQCYQLICETRMLDHIVIHSLQVCRVATFLTGQLNKLENRLDYNLIQAAALLHDITKTRSFKTEENHALTGAQYLSDRGYPEVGNLVRQHVRLDEYFSGQVIREAEIINYADKRVLHDEIVSLDARLNYILERYAKETEHRERIHLLWQKTNDLEQRIFALLPFAQADLTQFIQPQGYINELRIYQKLCARIEAGQFDSPR
jgi:putative nucleotidyltransferase with HDIG domain